MTAPKKTAAEKKAEADQAVSGWPKKVVWRDKIFLLPHPEDWSLDTLVAFEDNRQVTAIRRVLGEQWDRHGIGSMSTKETADLFEALAKAAGFDSAGE